MKTARLIQCACRLGALAAEADERRFAALSDYGHHLGVAFQIADDILDVTGSSGALGKTSGKDAAAGKQTYPRAVGLDESRREAQEAVNRAKCALAPLGPAAEPLNELADFVVVTYIVTRGEQRRWAVPALRKNA
jgi:geranylgeranyl pyrophosphate synthase